MPQNLFMTGAIGQNQNLQNFQKKFFKTSKSFQKTLKTCFEKPKKEIFEILFSNALFGFACHQPPSKCRWWLCSHISGIWLVKSFKCTYFGLISFVDIFITIPYTLINYYIFIIDNICIYISHIPIFQLKMADIYILILYVSEG